MTPARLSGAGVRFAADERPVAWWRVAVGYAVLGLIAAVALFPVVSIWLTGFKTDAELAAGFFGLPDTWRSEAFAEAWDRGRFGRFFVNSVIVVVPVVGGSLVLSTLAGFAFARWRFRGSTILFLGLLLGLMVPLEALVIPLYHGVRAVGLLNSPLALILPQIGLSVAFGTFWMRAFFLTLPADLLDAAAVDGAGPLATIRHVLVPLARPALATLAVLVFTWTWNEFLLALVLVSDESARTLPVGLAFFVGQHSSEVPLLAAAATILSTPIMVLFLIFQRSFIRGIAAGAVRG